MIILNAYKGMGKSAAFIEAAKIIQNESDDIVILQNQGQIMPNVNNGSYADWQKIWREKITECIGLEYAKCLYSEIKYNDILGHLKHRDLLTYAKGKGIRSSTSLFDVFNQFAIDFNIGFVNISKKSQQPENTVNETKIKQYIEGQNIWLFIDEVDINFNAFDDNERNKIAALLRTANDLCNYFKGLKIRISIRPNVLSILKLEFPALSGLRDYIMELKWDKESLEELVTKRIESYVGRNNIGINNVKNKIYLPLLFQGKFDLGSGDRDIMSFISKLSFDRPRWLIELCKTASFNALKSKQSHIRKCDFETSMAEFGKNRTEDLSAEFRAVCPDIPTLITAFTHSARYFNNYHNLTSFIKNKVDVNNTSIYNIKNICADDIAKLLFEINFIQAKEVISRPLKTATYDFIKFLRSDIFSDVANNIRPQKSHSSFEIECCSG